MKLKSQLPIAAFLLNKFLPLTFLFLGSLTSFANAQSDSSKNSDVSKFVSEKILGGTFINSSLTPVAYIEGLDFSCSGTLVGPSEVLTAAHCIFGSASEYSVYVGGNTHTAKAIYFNQAYDQEGTTDASNSQNDLGMIVLSTPVTSVSPVAIAAKAPLVVGQVGTIYGFGTNEIEYLRQPAINEKQGRILISSIATGMFSSEIDDTGVASCTGDSGGPVISSINSVPSVIGVVSTGGTDNLVDDTCTPGDGESNFVNLQSATSKNFLSKFSDLSIIAGDYSFIASHSASLEKSLIKASQSRNLSSLRKLATSYLHPIGDLGPYGDANRKDLIKKTLAAVKKAIAATTLRNAVRGLRTASTYLHSIVRLGK